MKKIKSGIKKDFESIPHKSKHEALYEAGVFPESEHKKAKIKLCRIVPVCAALAVILSLSAMFVFAVDDGSIIESIQSIFRPEKEESAEAKPSVVIEKQPVWSEEFNILVSYLHDSVDRTKDEHFYYRSVKDAVADMGEDLYCPEYDTNYASITFSHRGSGESAYSVIQIGYYDDTLNMFWIHEGTGHFGTGPEEQVYISNGNTFYIGDFNDGFSDGYLAWGVIDGNTYQLKTDTVENAKIIIDSLRPAE